MKLLLYCTKSKPYLKSHSEYEYDEKGAIPETRKRVFTLWQDKCNYYNGKIIADCDFEVEEIIKTNYDMIITGKEKTTMEDLLKNSCLTYDELEDYLKPNWKNTDMFMHCGYAIYIKNLHIFDKPRELSEFAYKPKKGYWKKCWLQLDSVNNMRYCYEKHPVNNTITDKQYIIISVKSEEMFRICNGEQSLLVRKKIINKLLDKIY